MFINIVNTQGIASGLCLILIAMLYRQLQETACIKRMLIEHVVKRCQELEREHGHNGRP
jgi:hypothetical protein